MKISWQALEPGDVVDVVAPASGTASGELRKVVQLLQSWGLRARMDEKILGGPSPILAQEDGERLRQLKRALLNQDSKVIWALRGGYGSLRLLPELAKLKKPRRVKLLVGFSDLTSLHSFVNTRWKWPSLHAPGLESLTKKLVTDRVEREVKAVLFGTQDSLEFKGLVPLNGRFKNRIVAPVVGGNMAVIQSSLGTRGALSGRGQVVVFEEVGEKLHRVDRMLVHMQQAGFFSGVRAVIFGDLLLDNKSAQRQIWNWAVRDFAQAAPFPVFKGLGIGHGPTNRPLPLMTRAELRSQEAKPSRAELTVHTGCAGKRGGS